jgi:hypothetical protein
MARRRREDTSNPPDSAPQESTSGEPQIEVKMRGSADDVKKQLGVATETKQEPEKKNGSGHGDEKDKFVEALRGSKYIIRVKRMTPREFNGIRTNVEVWNAELPLGYQEIQDEVTKEFGGGKYRVAVIDPNSNSTIAADTFVVDGDPLVPESDLTQEEQDRIFMQGKPKSLTDITEESLDRRVRLSAKLLEVEGLEAQLEEARSRRSNGGKPTPQDNTRIDDLERRLIEAKHQAELEARDRKHAEDMRELKAMLAQNAAPKKPENDMMMVMLEQMREDRKASQAQFTALLTQMKDDKLNAVLDEVKSIRNKPQQNNMLEMAETMLKLNKMISGVRDDDDDDDEDDKNDDRPWWERAIDKLGGKFGDKFLDKLMEKFSGMEGKGEEVTREEFMKNLQDEAQRVADEAVARARRQNLPQAAPNPSTLPAPPPSPRPAVTVPPPQVTTLPPPPPPPPPAETGLPAQAPPVETPPKLTVEQEIVLRVGGVLEILEREIELRPHEYHWNYEGALLSLPASILEKVCEAPDPIAMIDAFSIPHISPEKLSEMKEKISGNPKILAWVKVGHDELKNWNIEKQKDPSFDPFAEEDEESGEEG